MCVKVPWKRSKIGHTCTSSIGPAHARDAVRMPMCKPTQESGLRDSTCVCACNDWRDFTNSVLRRMMVVLKKPCVTFSGRGAPSTSPSTALSFKISSWGEVREGSDNGGRGEAHIKNNGFVLDQDTNNFYKSVVGSIRENWVFLGPWIAPSVPLPSIDGKIVSLSNTRGVENECDDVELDHDLVLDTLSLREEKLQFFDGFVAVIVLQ